MGCDWYTFRSIVGVGFVVSEKKWPEYEKMMSDEYGALIYTEVIDENESFSSSIFIYDKKTAMYSNITVPGPYEISKADHSTEIVKNQKMTSLLKDKVTQMCQKFNVESEVISYCLLQTSMGIGEFNQTLLGKNQQFESIKNYREYYGYEYDEYEEGN